MHAKNCSATEYAIYKTMQSIDCCCLTTEEREKSSCVHAGIKRCYGNTKHNLIYIICAFVANTECEYILRNATTEIKALEFYCLNKRKITKFSENFTPKYTPYTSTVHFRVIINEVSYHVTISLY